jgi:hypothetical protein
LFAPAGGRRATKIKQVCPASDTGLSNIGGDILPPLAVDSKYNLHADGIEPGRKK